MAFTDHRLLPGVTHIADPGGVCMTLLEGTESALLIDTGYGLADAAAHVRGLTDKPLHVLLTHGHHDHALGAMDFERVWLMPEDREVYETYTGHEQRKKVLAGAGQALSPEARARFLSAPVPEPDTPPAFVDLGGLTAHILACPGHTPGSAVVWVPEHRLLLTGDDWNPVTWLFFPEALPVRVLRQQLRALLRLPFERVLCSHRDGLWPREALTAFVEGLTDEALAAAEPSGEGRERGIDTVTVCPAPEQKLVFDRAKAGM